jgi:hypothetical protein
MPNTQASHELADTAGGRVFVVIEDPTRYTVLGDNAPKAQPDQPPWEVRDGLRSLQHQARPGHPPAPPVRLRRGRHRQDDLRRRRAEPDLHPGRGRPGRAGHRALPDDRDRRPRARGAGHALHRAARLRRRGARHRGLARAGDRQGSRVQARGEGPGLRQGRAAAGAGLAGAARRLQRAAQRQEHGRDPAGSQPDQALRLARDRALRPLHAQAAGAQQRPGARVGRRGAVRQLPT